MLIINERWFLFSKLHKITRAVIRKSELRYLLRTCILVVNQIPCTWVPKDSRSTESGNLNSDLYDFFFCSKSGGMHAVEITDGYSHAKQASTADHRVRYLIHTFRQIPSFYLTDTYKVPRYSVVRSLHCTRCLIVIQGTKH